MKRGSGIIILLCLFGRFAYSQNPPADLRPPLDIPKVVPATATATKITDFYAQKPNMYTGTANVSVPLHTINFDGWSIPITISYNATGVRVNEEAGEVGLGWALSASALISRQVNGGDDFFDGGTGGHGRGYVVADRAVTTDWGFLDAGHGGDNGGVAVPPDFFSSYYYKLASTNPDTQPDVFNYNFYGYSGSFVLTQQILGPVAVIKTTLDPCLVTFDFPTKTFTVTTPQGFKGIFDVKERSTTVTSVRAVLENSHVLDCCGMSYIDEEHLKQRSGQFRTTTSWYLSKIISPHGDEINYTYDLVNGRSHNVSLTRSFSEKTDDSDGGVVCIQTIQEHVYLTSITSEEVRVIFNMAADREDIRRNSLFWAGPNFTTHPLSENNFPTSTAKLKRYSSIVIDGVDPLSSLDKTITFQQTYFNQNNQQCTADNDRELDYLRLRLDRVIVGDQEYSFYYEKPNELPSKLASGVDHFGFSNGLTRDPIGLLKPPQIMHPRPNINPTNFSDSTAQEYYTVMEER